MALSFYNARVSEVSVLRHARYPVEPCQYYDNKKLTLPLEQGLSLSQKKEINFGAASAWDLTKE
jgi:hypothetical protein